jgi:hypothetical protein
VAQQQGYKLLSKLLEKNFRNLKILFFQLPWKKQRALIVKEVIDENIKMVYSVAESRQKKIAKNIFTWDLFLHIREKYDADMQNGKRDIFAGTHLSFALKNSKHWDHQMWHFIDKEKLLLNMNDYSPSINQNNIGYTLRKGRTENVSLAKDEARDRIKLKYAIESKDIRLIDDLIKKGIDLSYTDRSGTTFSDMANKEGENILAFALLSGYHWQLFDLSLIEEELW